MNGDLKGFFQNALLGTVGCIYVRRSVSTLCLRFSSAFSVLLSTHILRIGVLFQWGSGFIPSQPR